MTENNRLEPCFYIEHPHVLDDQEYFMAVALLSAKYSDCSDNQTGACLVGSNKTIIGIGYDRTCCAAIYSILNKNDSISNECTIYLTKFACKECTKCIIQSGIKTMYYIKGNTNGFDVSKAMLDAAQVKHDQPKRSINLLIHFSENVFRLKKYVRPDKLQKNKTCFSCSGTELLSSSEYFMALALLTSKCSNDPDVCVGACIVDEERDRVISVGCNNMPNGCEDFSWYDKSCVCHAEVNAMFNNKNQTDIRGCTMYVTLFPCYECSRIIEQSGIKRIVYLSDRCSWIWGVDASRRALLNRGLRLDKFESTLEIIPITDKKRN